MPCQSYESSWANSSSDSEVRKLKKEADKLARIACRALQELEDNGIEDMLLLKDDETREWWAKHKEADRKAREKREAQEHRARVKAEALAKLSEEEKQVLGIVKPKKTKTSKLEYDEYDCEDEDTLVQELHDAYDKVFDQGGIKIWLDKAGDVHVAEDDDDGPF